MRVVALDWETFYSTDYSVKTLGYDRYCRHSQFDPYLISVADATETWAGPLKEFNWRSLDGCQLLSFNSAFDEEVTLAAAEIGLIDFKPDLSNWFCVSNMSRYMFNVGSLKDAAKIGLGVDVDKGVRDRAKSKHWADMVAEGWANDMCTYALGRCATLFRSVGQVWAQMAGV